MSASLLSGGVKKGNNFIKLFLDFNLDFSLHDTLCTGDRAVDAQFSWRTLLFLPPLMASARGLRCALYPVLAAELAAPSHQSSVCLGRFNLIFCMHKYSALCKFSINKRSSLDCPCFLSQLPQRWWMKPRVQEASFLSDFLLNKQVLDTWDSRLSLLQQ